MNVLLLAPIAVCLLLGAVAIGIGHKRWSWGTVAAAWLVLLSAAGFLYLAARVAERERAWRRIVVGLQADITKARDAMVPGSDGHLEPQGKELSLAALGDERSRWQRALEQAETWRNRHWDNASFKPPQGDNAGTISFDFENDSVTKPPINPGAEVAVFDDAPAEEGGRFLGVFRVDAATSNKEQQKHVLTVQPATPPDQREKDLWGKTYESVTLYEDLPVDRWIAFHRTQTSAAPGEGAGPPTVLPTDASELLKGLKILDEIERQKTAESVAEEEWQKLADVWEQWKQAGEGTEQAAAAKAAKERAIPTGQYWADVEFKEQHSFEPDAADPREFAAGDSGSFDLETALELRKLEKAEIKRVFYRRPLTDAFTALRGGAIIPEKNVQADGMLAIRAALQQEIATAEAAIQRLGAARKNTANQIASMEIVKDQLEKDRNGFQADAKAGEQSANAFDARLRQVTGELAAARQAVVRLGGELGEAVGRLTAEIDRRAPRP